MKYECFTQGGGIGPLQNEKTEQRGEPSSFVKADGFARGSSVRAMRRDLEMDVKVEHNYRWYTRHEPEDTEPHQRIVCSCGDSSPWLSTHSEWKKLIAWANHHTRTKPNVRKQRVSAL